MQSEAAVSPAHNGTPTSAAAAKSMQGLSLRIRGQVLRFLTDRRLLGATSEEVEHALEIAGNTCRPRLVELRQLGLVKDSGRTRKTKSGRQAIIWIAAL